MYTQKQGYDIGEVVETPNVDVMVIGKKFIPATAKYMYLIPSPEIINVRLVWVTEDELDSFNIS